MHTRLRLINWSQHYSNLLHFETTTHLLVFTVFPLEKWESHVPRALISKLRCANLNLKTRVRKIDSSCPRTFCRSNSILAKESISGLAHWYLSRNVLVSLSDLCLCSDLGQRWIKMNASSMKWYKDSYRFLGFLLLFNCCIISDLSTALIKHTCTEGAVYITFLGGTSKWPALPMSYLRVILSPHGRFLVPSPVRM